MPTQRPTPPEEFAYQAQPVATIVDIARVCQVSSASVSRVLTGLPGVKAMKREEILKAAEALGYRPNRAARRLVTQKSHLLGFIASDLRNAAYLEYFHTLERAVRADGYEFLIADSERSADRERANIERMLDNRVDGLMVLPVSDWIGPGNIKHLERLQMSRLPSVLFGHLEGAQFDSVSSDEFHAARLLIEHLHHLGHQKFGFIELADAMNRPQNERLQGVLNAMHSLNLPSSCLRVMDANTPHWTEDIIDALNSKSAPTALICVNDLLALSLLRPFQKAGISVPEAVSIVAFGKTMLTDTALTDLVSPSLTLAEFDNQAVAKNGAAMLLERLANPSLPYRTVRIPASFVIRESTTLPQQRSVSSLKRFSN